MLRAKRVCRLRSPVVDDVTADLVLGPESVAEDLVLPDKRPSAPRKPLTFTREAEPVAETLPEGPTCAAGSRGGRNLRILRSPACATQACRA